MLHVDKENLAQSSLKAEGFLPTPTMFLLCKYVNIFEKKISWVKGHGFQILGGFLAGDGC